jgi:hypothetical protein
MPITPVRPDAFELPRAAFADCPVDPARRAVQALAAGRSIPSNLDSIGAGH